MTLTRTPHRTSTWLVALAAAGALVAVSALSSCSSNTLADAEPTVTEAATTSTTIVAATTTSTTSTTTTTTTSTTTTTTIWVSPNFEPVGKWEGDIVPVNRRSGKDTAVVQMRLTQLGFWTGNPDGQFGHATVQAVMAFQKYVGLEATGRVDQATADALEALDAKAHGDSDNGTLVEVDKGRQLLFLVVDGKSVWTFNTSTGSGVPYEEVNENDPSKIEKGDAITPNGLWQVNRERPDGWWEGDLGEIYRPKYFRGGIAIHGMRSVPNYPASHGCVRLSLPAMDFIWDNNLIPMGTPVWVHD